MTEWESELFPANYWQETRTFPPLRIVPHYSGEAWRLVRTYVNQEGGTSARIILEDTDLSDLEHKSVILEQALHVGLEQFAGRKIQQSPSLAL
jgi:hypothetical protein